MCLQRHARASVVGPGLITISNMTLLYLQTEQLAIAIAGAALFAGFVILYCKGRVIFQTGARSMLMSLLA